MDAFVYRQTERYGTNLLWDDAKEMLVPKQRALSLGIPYEINSPEKPHQDGEDRYDQLLLNDVKGFDDFLLNPITSYKLYTYGTRYYKDDYSETKITVTVTISMGPEFELAPLKPVNDPELAPLEPLGEEIRTS